MFVLLVKETKRVALNCYPMQYMLHIATNSYFQHHLIWQCL